LEFNVPFQHKYGYIRDEYMSINATKLLRLNTNYRLKHAHQQIISLSCRLRNIFLKLKRQYNVYGNVVDQSCSKCTLSINSLFNIAHGYSCFAQLTTDSPYTLQRTLKHN